MLFQAVMPLCLCESTLRKHVSGRKRVVRTGVVVISLDSGDKRKKESSLDNSKSIVSKATKNRSSVERKAKGETRKADETKSKEKNGFLQKRGGNIFRKSWHKRYVVLKDGKIYYYTSNRKNERCRGSYVVNKSCTVQVCSSSSSSKRSSRGVIDTHTHTKNKQTNSIRTRTVLWITQIHSK